MKLQKQIFVKVVVGLLLITVAGALSYVIKQGMAQRVPESALPEIQVMYNEAPLPAMNVMMDSYEWRFLKVQTWVEPDRNRWRNMDAASVLPNAPLEVVFSFPCESMVVKRATGDSEEFVPVKGGLMTPSEPGTYTYSVEANWGVSGSVLYYFKVVIAPPSV